MRCLAPIQVENKFPTKENPYTTTYVPCGKCEACVKRKSLEWFLRLKEEVYNSRSSWFVTLTYNQDNLPSRITNGRLYHDVSKGDLQLFHKYFRRALGTDGSDYKYYSIGEYGLEEQRPHYHEICFNVPYSKLELYSEVWNKGFITIEEVTDGRLKYVTGYVIEKLFTPDGCLPVFNNISKGLGSSYIDRMADYHENDPTKVFVPFQGSKMPMPRYYKERLFSKSSLKTHAAILSQEAQERVSEYLKNHSFHEMELRNHELRANYIREVRERRKKSKQKS